jgi:hypothetical protein
MDNPPSWQVNGDVLRIEIEVHGYFCTVSKKWTANLSRKWHLWQKLYLKRLSAEQPGCAGILSKQPGCLAFPNWMLLRDVLLLQTHMNQMLFSHDGPVAPEPT